MALFIISPFKGWFPRLDAGRRCFGFTGAADVADNQAPEGFERSAGNA